MQISSYQGNTRRSLLLPLHRGIGNECRLIFEADNRRVAEADGPNEAGLIVYAVNNSVTVDREREIISARDREWSNRLQSQDLLQPGSLDLDVAIAWYVSIQKVSKS